MPAMVPGQLAHDRFNGREPAYPPYYTAGLAGGAAPSTPETPALRQNSRNGRMLARPYPSRRIGATLTDPRILAGRILRRSRSRAEAQVSNVVPIQRPVRNSVRVV